MWAVDIPRAGGQHSYGVEGERTELHRGQTVAVRSWRPWDMVRATPLLMLGLLASTGRGL